MTRPTIFLSTIAPTIGLLCLIVLSQSTALVTPSLAVPKHDNTLTTSLHLASGEGAKPDQPASAQELFKSEGWAPIKKDLDSVPIFCVANKEGKPIVYSVTVKKREEGTNGDDAQPSTFQIPFFYTDVEDAKAELKKAKDESDDKTMPDELDLIPFPLGVAFEMWTKDQAAIIPSGKAVQQAGAPPGTSPIGQSVPLFACMEIMQEMEVPSEDGETKNVPVLPLFMVLEECNAAVDEAVKMDGGKADEFEVISLSLTRAVEQLATVPGTPGFQLIPPQASIQYINTYLTE